MLNINLIRVDERLIHGQIIIKWIQFKNANKILIIDDEVAKDPIIEKILRMSVPQKISLEIYGLEEGIKTIIENSLNDNVIVLVKELWTVKSMHEKGVEIKEVNIGRIPSGPGRKKIFSNVYLSSKDIDAINYFEKRNIPIIIQIVPDSTPIEVYDLI